MVNASVDASRNYFPSLTGLRAVAAYLVFWHHENPLLRGTFGHQLVNQGYVGVSLFFVLSGFLIYHRYASTATNSATFWIPYLQNRFARIMPLYWLLLLLTFTIWQFTGSKPVDWRTFWLNLTLLKGFSGPYKFSGIAQSWSLTVEWCFYLLAPWLFVALRCVRPFWLATGLGSIGLVVWRDWSFMWFYTFFGRSFEFLVGMWLARCLHEERLPAITYSLWLGLWIIAVCVGLQIGCQRSVDNPYWQIWAEVVLYNLVLPVGIGLVFIDLLSCKTRWSSMLASPFLQALGRSSYAFYLIHIGVVNNLLEVVCPSPVWLKFIGLILISHALYWLVEQPLKRLLSSF